MSGSIQNKLLQLEVAPPPSVWEKISLRLDEEHVNADIIISAKLDNTALNPPSSAWDNISSAIHQDVVKKVERPAKVVPIIYRRIAIAVILAGVMAVAAMYIFTGSNHKVSSGNAASNEVAAITEDSNPAPLAATEPRPPANDSPAEKTAISSNILARASRAIGRKISVQPPAYESIPSPDIEQAHLNELQTVPDLQAISVSAPPIRDARGNIIMDMKLISKPHDPYIVVTGPNGKQTKISNKFLSCLSYINSNFSSPDMDPEGRECKTRFEEWRNKLLSEATFIPAANNFFDIFELKDMIQD